MKVTRVNLGEIIKQLVEERGLSQSRFAALIGLKRQNIVKTVFDKHSLDTDLLCTISEVLECNLFNYFQSDVESKETELRATLTISLGKEKKNKSMRFVFGENEAKVLL